MERFSYLDVLDLFFWGMDKVTKPTFCNLLAGYDEYYWRSPTAQLIDRLKRQKLLTQTGKGSHALFSITATGRERLVQPSPRTAWDRAWAGSWYLVTFDLPANRERDRHRLWRALRAHKLGLLQRSVWIWPHPLEPILHEIIHTQGVPECFCGFEARQVFLCSDSEIVATAWDWEQIQRRQRGYLQQPRLTAKHVTKAGTVGELLALSQLERDLYNEAFWLDPLLPRALWPPDYRGTDVQQRHEELRHRLGSQLKKIALQSRTTIVA